MRTEYPCEWCGVPVFQRTATRKRFCSHSCMNKAWHARNPGSRKRRNGNQSHSVTVTYTDTDGKQLTTVGVGKSKAKAREDADAQVPVWFSARGPLSTYASTPASILRSLQRAQ